jgi:hypothetical protein
MPSKFPNFLIIGATKSGTTSLYHYLSQHPEIYMSHVKEPHFFAYEGQTLDFKGPGDMEIASQMIVTEKWRYEQLFDGVTNEKAIGEASAMYLYCEGTAERIKRYLPEVKLIIILRNPVERAYSSYIHLRRDGRENLKDFLEALDAEESRIESNWMPIWHYKKMGFYYEQLSIYYQFFKKEQIKIYLFDEIKKQPMEIMQELYKWLGVDPNFVPDMSLKYNVSGLPKKQWIHFYLRKPHWTKTIIKPLLPERFRKYIMTNMINKNLSKKQEMQDEWKNFLLNLYETEFIRLGKLLNKDLSNWQFPDL